MSQHLPQVNSDYGDIEYWNERYKNEDSYEWFKPYAAFRHLVHQHIKTSDRILVLGCGTSPLSLDLYKDGFHKVTNVDYSDVVIQKMASLQPQMQWKTMDIRSMAFPSGSFDVVLDKGTLDALLASTRGSPWAIPDEARATVGAALREVSRILNPNGGRFISITFEQPHFRRKVVCMENYGWDFQTYTFGDDFHYFFYVMTRGKELASVWEPQVNNNQEMFQDDEGDKYLCNISVDDL